MIEFRSISKTFPDGTAFFDYRHGKTGAPLLKVQHPEFELWSLVLGVCGGLQVWRMRSSYNTLDRDGSADI